MRILIVLLSLLLAHSSYAIEMIGFGSTLGPGSHTFDTNSRVTGSANPLDNTYTCGAGTTLLVVAIAADANGSGSNYLRTGGAPTYNSVTMTQAGPTRVYSTTGEVAVEIFYLIDPPTGSAYTVSIPNTRPNALYVQRSSYKASTGYTSALDNVNGGTGVSANPGVLATTTVNGAVIVGAAGTGHLAGFTADSHTTLDLTTIGTAFGEGNQYYLQATAGEVTLSWTASTDDWAAAVAAFKVVAQ